MTHGNAVVYEWRYTKNHIKSKMEIDPASQMARGVYECIADNKWTYDKRRFRTDYVEI